MSTKYKFHDQDQLYFVSFAVVNWIDLFTRNEYKDIMIESWKHCQLHKGLEIYGWCIMSSHIHMIIGTHGEKLENIMRDMKKHTSIALKKAIREHYGESPIQARESVVGKRDGVLVPFRKVTNYCYSLSTFPLSPPIQSSFA